ncbi:hypothetical protein BU26DRAFT_512919, partial [Trematosphaeria pertusa]
MPQKRPHHKSRYGCDRCRKRRVKCDEKLPQCTNCTKRGDECCFSRQLFQQSDLPNATGPQAESLNAASVVPADAIGISEVALMHHWCTRTCYSFTPKGAELFREHVGQEALRHDYLMEALLALTLLHMASEMEDATAARPLVSAALQYQNRSVSGLRSNLNHISRSNCDAVFTCSVLIMVCAVVSPLLPSGGDDQPKPIAESILILADFINAIASIVQLSRHWIVQGPLSGVFGIVEPMPSSMDEWAAATELRRLMDTAVCPSSYKHAVLERAIQALEKAFRREHCAVVWVTRVDSEFMEELRGGEPLAMMIFMHWGVLLYITDDMWWKRYSGSRLVDELSAVLLGRSEEWDKITIWCRQQVELC